MEDEDEDRECGEGAVYISLGGGSKVVGGGKGGSKVVGGGNVDDEGDSVEADLVWQEVVPGQCELECWRGGRDVQPPLTDESLRRRTGYVLPPRSPKRRNLNNHRSSGAAWATGERT